LRIISAVLGFDILPRHHQGRKSANSVKILGPNLETLIKLANDIQDQMSKVKGICDLRIFPVFGQPNLNIKIDRAKAEGRDVALIIFCIPTMSWSHEMGQALTRLFFARVQMARRSVAESGSLGAGSGMEWGQPDRTWRPSPIVPLTFP
jgi:hypothetical protein